MSTFQDAALRSPKYRADRDIRMIGQGELHLHLTLLIFHRKAFCIAVYNVTSFRSRCCAAYLFEPAVLYVLEN